MPEHLETLGTGKFLHLVRRGRWEYAIRPTGPDAVSIVAITNENKLVLVEQHRPPANGPVIELPAGLAGDDHAEESLLEAARRELAEETGYEADHWTPLVRGLSSSGLSDERVTLFLAKDLRRTGRGGGIGDEAITLHEVPLAELSNWLHAQLAQGKQIDLKLLAGVFAAQEHLRHE